MRIGIIVDNEFNNDIRVRNEALALQRDGHDVIVLCFDFGSNFENNYNGIRIIRWHLKPALKNILFALFHSFNIYSYLWAKKIIRFSKENKIEILHVHDLYMAKSGYIAKRKLKIPLVLDLHENYPYAVDDYKWMHKKPATYLIRPKRWKKIEGRFLSYADKIVALSSTFKMQLLAKYSFLQKENIIVYPNAPDVETLISYPIDDKIIPKGNDYSLFYFGGISKRRGVFLVINALRVLKKQIPTIKLLLIGPVDKAEQKEFELLINSGDVKKHIIYYPWKDISLLPSFIKYSDICLSPIEKNPQHESGIANKVFQYMLFERPVLVSNCGPQAEVINESKAGLVHQWDSIQDFCDKVLYLYKNRNEADTMGKNGKKAVIEKYNQKELIKPLIRFYSNKA
ncbi:MAG: glycosyl transferase family 1 [Bacteroidetes bacterium]|nr:MAG: glycosyl transferase family 1 [Bacteroidota bacterium]